MTRPDDLFYAPEWAVTEGSLLFTLRCKPTAQARARHAIRPDGSHAAYKGKKQEAREKELAALLAPYRPARPLEGALELRFMALFTPPKGLSRKEAAALIDGKVGHTVKPDLDNLAKQLKDAMTRAGFWHDDRQVARLCGAKEYAEESCWIVRLRKIAEARA